MRSQTSVISPSLCIVIDKRLVKQKVPPMGKSQWMEINENLIKEMGARKWLDELLDTLEDPNLHAVSPSAL